MLCLWHPTEEFWSNGLYFPSWFGRDKSPSFSVPYLKAHKSIIFYFLRHNQNLQSIRIFKLTLNIRSSIILSKNFQRSSQRFRRPVLALVHVSFNFFKFFFISSDNLLSLSFFITPLSPLAFSLFFITVKIFRVFEYSNSH